MPFAIWIMKVSRHHILPIVSNIRLLLERNDAWVKEGGLIDREAGFRPDRTGLRPELRAMLEALDASPPVDFADLSPTAERIGAKARLAELWGLPEEVERIEMAGYRSDDAVIRARIYRPAGARGTVLFLHGGGWVVGSLDTHDGSCRMLANKAQATVVSIEYRKAPEHPFPAAVRDCDGGLDWLLRHGPTLGLDAERLIVCGESAGGNLAAVLALHARDRGVPLAGQALIYPVIDTDMSRGSYSAFGEGFYLSAPAMAWFISHYAGAAELRHPDIAPLRAADLSNLAPTFLVTMSHDPLRDEGRAYAAALVAAGNDVHFEEMPGTVHGLWLMNRLTPGTAELIGKTARWIRKQFE